jgi:Flp pilus assembly protein TadD
VPALEQLASILSDISDATRLEPVVARLVAEAPKSTWSHYYAGSLFFMQNRLDMARNSVGLDPGNAKAQNLLGACLASMGQGDAARAAFEASLKADPREPGTYTNLATLELQAGNRARALQYFAEALTVDPMSQTAREGLASIRASQ